MKIIKKIFKNKTYINSNKKEVKSSMFVIVLDNGKEIPIKPIFNEGYTQLELVSTAKVIGK